ncbi:MAG: YggS family pyridoxal phosphate-dependent enzyme [Pyrinomonadaceae bacterium]|nr:YggS family pyridoxal phosphate-dependent enzyme [Pyrinomonadaceae bacterium]
MSESLAQRLSGVRNQIKLAAEKAGRKADEITLVAVSKTHPAALVSEAVEAGAVVFGENKVQEAEGKIAEIKNVEWHLIGHLQSNKARKAVKLFDVIQTVDSIELAERLERICLEENRQDLKIFVQVDLGNEETKSGVSETDLPKLLEFIGNCKCLKLLGLMQIPPFFEEVEKVRPFFRRLREIRDELLPDGKLSMGMSHDFTVAIEEGATHIRVGTAIFGEREYK